MLEALLNMGFGMGVIFVTLALILPLTLVALNEIARKLKARKRRKQVQARWLEKRPMKKFDGVYISNNVFPIRPPRSAETSLDEHYDRVLEIFSESK
jgi:hypothetical protein